MLKMELTITEALCGFQKVISTLDSREIVITAVPGEVHLFNAFHISII